MSVVYLQGWDADAKVWRKVLVNSDGKLIIDPSEIFEDPPTENETGKAPQSAWAFDHEADESAHHVKYTDVESRAAIGDLLNSVGLLLKTLNFNYNKITNLQKFTMRYAEGSKYYMPFTVSAAAPGLYLDCYESGVGYVQSYLYISNGVDPEKVAVEPVVDTKISVHAAIAAAHHAKYTDAEALMVRANNSLTLETGEYTDQDVSGKGLLILDTAGGNIDLKGLSGGTEGQMIYCLKISWVNILNVYWQSGDAAAGDKIYTYNGANDSIAASKLGGFWLVYFNNNWYTERHLNI